MKSAHSVSNVISLPQACHHTCSHVLDPLQFEDGSSLLALYDTLKLLVRHIRHYAVSVEQVNADFIMNYMDVVTFDLSSIVRPPSPPVPRPSPPASPHPPTPPTRPVSPASPSVSEGYISTPTSLFLQVEPEQP